ncbi:hypothetical protein CKA38_04445 [Ereboglobus luteus]|uniref:Uncharacterized protein n=2 Tax=Ereboglobus luteus TaxID=1796921 RepID=A0A2U8E1E3_9BACT|nr:hypothetical protein CKA38_04445 [Ereboglobus luteus]
MRMLSKIIPQKTVCVLLSLTLIFSGCASAPRADREIPFTGNYLTYHQANINVASPRNKVLWQYRAAGTAIRRGEHALAKTFLDDALAAAAAAYGQPNSDAAKSRGLFKSEAGKPFYGEPYERVMANFYRALLYWADGEPDNARALLRTAALLDSDTVDKTYAADYILLDYLDGFITAKLSGNPDAGAGALARARSSAALQHVPAPPDYDLKTNVHLFVEYGRAPIKYAAGQAGERLWFTVRKGPVRHVRLHVAGQTQAVPAYDDLGYQATTRGPRVMDHVLGNKVAFKENTGMVADAALAIPSLLATALVNTEFGIGDVPAPYNPPPPTRPPKPRNSHKPKHKDDHDDGNGLGAVLAPIAIGIGALVAIGLGASALSNATKTEADTRAWENLPRHLCYLPLTLPPGTHPVTLDFLDEDMQPVYLQKQTFTITVPTTVSSFAAGPADIIVFRSQLHD